MANNPMAIEEKAKSAATVNELRCKGIGGLT